MIEPKVFYVIIDDGGDVIFPVDFIKMERTKARFFKTGIIHEISDMAKSFIEMTREESESLVAIKKVALLSDRIEITDVIVDKKFKSTDLIVARNEINRKIFVRLTRMMSPEVFMAMYEFNILNSKFISMGFNITQENRQEIYLKIIDQDSDELLDDLELYLKSKNIVDNMYTFYRSYRKLQSDLKYCSTAEEANKLYDEYTRR